MTEDDLLTSILRISRDHLWESACWIWMKCRFPSDRWGFGWCILSFISLGSKRGGPQKRNNGRQLRRCKARSEIFRDHFCHCRLCILDWGLVTELDPSFRVGHLSGMSGGFSTGFSHHCPYSPMNWLGLTVPYHAIYLLVVWAETTNLVLKNDVPWCLTSPSNSTQILGRHVGYEIHTNQIYYSICEYIYIYTYIYA